MNLYPLVIEPTKMFPIRPWYSISRKKQFEYKPCPAFTTTMVVLRYKLLWKQFQVQSENLYGKQHHQLL